MTWATSNQVSKSRAILTAFLASSLSMFAALEGQQRLRKDHSHKLSTSVAQTHSHVAIEDLHIAGMVRNQGEPRAARPTLRSKLPTAVSRG